MALIDEPHHRSTMQVIEAAIFGETMEERDEKVLKKYIIQFYQAGISINQISKAVKKKEGFVNAVIEEFESSKDQK